MHNLVILQFELYTRIIHQNICQIILCMFPIDANYLLWQNDHNAC